MNIRVGIVGISGFGGGEAMRLVARHPSFELVYAAGEGSAGSRLVERFPSVPAKLAEMVIEKGDPATLPKLDVLFVSLPTGASAEALARVPKDVKIVDIGGDPRSRDGGADGVDGGGPRVCRGVDVWSGRRLALADRRPDARCQSRLLPRCHTQRAGAAAGQQTDRAWQHRDRRQDRHLRRWTGQWRKQVRLR